MSWFLGSRSVAQRSGIMTVLDVGSSKVCCIIARLLPNENSRALAHRTHRIKVIGIGHQKSQGVKSGVIVDLDAAEQAIRLAVDAAERMAGLTVDSLIVTFVDRLRAGESLAVDQLLNAVHVLTGAQAPEGAAAEEVRELILRELTGA